MHKPAAQAGRGRGGRGGRGRRGGQPSAGRAAPRQRQPGAARRVNHARAEKKMKFELKLMDTSIINSADTADPDVDEDDAFDAAADFNEDVLSHHSSEEAVTDDDDADAAADTSDAEPHQLPDDVAHGPAHTLAVPVPMMRCFQHWVLTIGAVLRALAASALNPTRPQPKCISLLQRSGQDCLVWFANEPTPKPPAVEGRIVIIDKFSRVKYTHPGFRRKKRS